MRRTLVECRVSGVVHALALHASAREPLQWAALETLDARLSLCARGYSPHAHLVVLRAPYKGARFPSKFRIAYFTFIAPNSARFYL